MALGDYIYRIKPQSGQTVPVNTVNGSQTLSGGTLIDRGGGDYAWQISGGTAITGSMDSLSRTTSGSTPTGEGWTQAATIRITTWPSADFQLLLGACVSALTDGVAIGVLDTAANTLRARIANAITVGSPSAGGSVDITLVHRVTPNKLSTSSDYHELWWTIVGRSGNAAQAEANDVISSPFALSAVRWESPSSVVYQVKDYVFWSEELSDANCAALADGLRATLDGSGSAELPPLTMAPMTPGGRSTGRW